MPEDCTLEDIQYHLYVKQMVDEGIAEVDAGKTIPHDEAKKRMRESPDRAAAFGERLLSAPDQEGIEHNP